jgi:crossover junction endodeoxyribonuclease RuvC
MEPHMTKVTTASSPSCYNARQGTDGQEGHVVLGVDPGLKGALAFYDVDNGKLDVFDMPTYEVIRNGKTKRDVDADEVGRLVREHHPVRATVEKVGATPQMGVTSSFTFGEGYGVIRGVVAGVGIKLNKVNPQTWQRDMQARGSKRASRDRAAALFPSAAEMFARVKDDGRADATLIAAWGAAHG